MNSQDFLSSIIQEEERLQKQLNLISSLRIYYMSNMEAPIVTSNMSVPEVKKTKTIRTSNRKAPAAWSTGLKLSKKVIYALKLLKKGTSNDVFNQIIALQPEMNTPGVRIRVNQALSKLYIGENNGITRVNGRNVSKYNRHIYQYDL